MTPLSLYKEVVVMRTKSIFLILFVLFIGFLSFSCAHSSKKTDYREPPAYRFDPVKKAARSVVGIWEPERHKASLTGVYGNLKGPISIMAAGVVYQKRDGSVVVLTTALPKRPLTLEFAQDREFLYMPIKNLMQERAATVERSKIIGNRKVLFLGARTGKIPIPNWVGHAEIDRHPLGPGNSQAFMVINYLGRPELAIWGKVQNGIFVEKTGLSRSFAVPGSPIFNKYGQLIGLYQKGGNLLPVIP